MQRNSWWRTAWHCSAQQRKATRIASGNAGLPGRFDPSAWRSIEMQGTATHGKAKQIRLGIGNSASPDVFSHQLQKASNCTEPQCRAVQSKSGRPSRWHARCVFTSIAKGIAPHRRAWHRIEIQRISVQSKSVWSFSEWPHRCVFTSTEWQCKAAQRKAPHRRAEQIGLSLSPDSFRCVFTSNEVHRMAKH